MTSSRGRTPSTAVTPLAVGLTPFARSSARGHGPGLRREMLTPPKDANKPIAPPPPKTDFALLIRLRFHPQDCGVHVVRFSRGGCRLPSCLPTPIITPRAAGSIRVHSDDEVTRSRERRRVTRMPRTGSRMRCATSRNLTSSSYLTTSRLLLADQPWYCPVGQSPAAEPVETSARATDPHRWAFHPFS